MKKPKAKPTTRSSDPWFHVHVRYHESLDPKIQERKKELGIVNDADYFTHLMRWDLQRAVEVRAQLRNLSPGGAPQALPRMP